MSDRHRAPEQWRPPAAWLRVVLAAILAALAAAFIIVVWLCLTLPSRGHVVVPAPGSTTPGTYGAPTWVAGS